jgi:cytochrome c553
MVFALSTGHEIGLAVTGACFIGFALISSFVLPARYPDFPGKYRNLYIVVCVCFFAAMITAVLVFGKEEPVAASAAAPPGSTTTTTTPTATTGGLGNATAGAAVFKSAGCTGCHTLKAAGSTGTVGPNLDQLKPAYATIVHQVTNGGGGMPPFGSSLSKTQIDDVAAYVFTSTH